MDVLGKNNLPFKQSNVVRSLFNTGGGGEGTSLLEGNVDVPLDGVTFSRLD